ncbi:M4 family metallopeptidase [Amycolatopsis thailandensis]|nr:M4 family metallopeptidase [Amycolatopsis thailandensis]
MRNDNTSSRAGYAWPARFGLGAAKAVIGTLAGLGATWLGLLIAATGSGFDASAADQLRRGAGGVFTAFGAGLGAPVDWRFAGTGWTGRIWPVELLGQASPLLWVLLGPAAALLVTAFLARWRGCGLAGVLGIGLGYVVTVGGGLLLVDTLNTTGGPALLTLSTPWLVAAGFTGAWVLVIAVLGKLCAIAVTRIPQAGPRHRFAVLAMVIALVASTTVAAGGRPAMGGYPSATAAAIDRLRQESGSDFLLAMDTQLDVPSLIGVNSSLRSGTGGWLTDHAALFGLPDPARQLRQVQEDTDRLGQKHIRYQQTVDGVPVHNAVVIMHLNTGGESVRAISSSARPDLTPVSTTPDVGADKALAVARKALPQGKLIAPIQLFVRGERPAKDRKTDTRLVWRVWLSDPSSNTSNDYYVDAHNGHLRWSDNKFETGRDIKVLDDQHQGTDSEEAPNPETVWAGGHHVGPNDVLDADKAYDWTGATYTYYRDKFGRDGIDGKGMTILSHVRHAVDWVNAGWGGDAMYFGDNMVTPDVTGHELTHGVIQYTANLDYLGSPGALNESYADIFGKMVQRHATGKVVTTDWTIGAGSAAGVIRNMADPNNGNDGNDETKFWQPDHMDEYVYTCMDNGGVHYNSGIANRAYVIMAQAIGEDRAEQIAFRALTTYLVPTSAFFSAAQATVLAARDLYGQNTPETLAAQQSWQQVGVLGREHEYVFLLCICFIPIIISDTDMDQFPDIDVPADDILAGAGHVRDLMQRNASPALTHYGRVIMDTGKDIMDIFNKDRALRDQFIRTMTTLSPALVSVLTDEGDTVVVTKQMVDQSNALFDAMVAYGTENERPDVVKTVTEERADVTPALIGKTANQAMDELDKHTR